MQPPETVSGVSLDTGFVVDVNTADRLYDVQLERSNRVLEDIPRLESAVSIGGGGYSGSYLKKRTKVVVARPRGSSTWVILGALAVPTPDYVDPEDPTQGELGARSDHKAGRNGDEPGDHVMQNDLGGHMAVRNNGVLEVYANEFLWSRYFPNERAIRQFCQSYQTAGFFGLSEFFTSREENTDASGQTPTGYRARIKSRTASAPHVWMDAGTVRGEEEVRLPGLPKRSEKGVSNLCFRFLVFDQEMVDRYSAAGEGPPPPGAARMALRADEEGNVLWASAGTMTFTAGETVINSRTRLRMTAGSGLDILSRGTTSLKSRATMTLASDKAMALVSGGDVVVRCRRFRVQADNDEYEVQGPWKVRAGGVMELHTSAHMSVRAGGDKTVSTAGSNHEVVGGRKGLIVLGNSAPENIGRDFSAYRMVVKNGAYRQTVERGSIELRVGPEQAPLATVIVHNDVTKPTEIGRIELRHNISGAKVLISSDGSFEIGGRAGGIHGDAAGNVQLGRTAGVPGYIVTSASHQDYVTGLPLRGVPGAVVNQTAAGVPGPGVPVVPPVPTLPEVPIPDAD
jgi:hypothetical protein